LNGKILSRNRGGVKRKKNAPIDFQKFVLDKFGPLMVSFVLADVRLTLPTKKIYHILATPEKAAYEMPEL
jgi:hypothetical protein